ncbi:hypothetical protein NQF78_24200 [Pseudomonas monsensis]|uniref:Uncharacterized protein n=1 Tax=Pseudomonas monsensis TaxID=2745509 RepID=A0ABT3Z1B2_9PSED|nr:hypothetical protein [Pseudomonas monsensis]MCY0111417.1 hypothetical protein [Pseudomonas monsensis]
MEVIEIRMDNSVSRIVAGEPVTLGFTLETDGTPPPVGSRLQFRTYHGATFLHASMPQSGATLSHSSGYSNLTITEPQVTGWNPRRTLTFTTDRDVELSKVTEVIGMVYYQPEYEDGYWPVFVQTGAEQAISTRQAFAAKWQDASGGWIYSYDVKVTSNSQQFSQWKFSSAGLPAGTKIYTQPWLDVVHDATEGIIELVTPPGDQYLLEPGKELPISIQLLYPAAAGQAPEFESLPNLMAAPR